MLESAEFEGAPSRFLPSSPLVASLQPPARTKRVSRFGRQWRGQSLTPERFAPSNPLAGNRRTRNHDGRRTGARRSPPSIIKHRILKCPTFECCRPSPADQTISFNSRTYTAALGSTLDVVDGDAQAARYRPRAS